MARYIDADKADVERISCFYGAECRIEDVKEWLDEQPTADVEEVKHGYWTKYSTELFGSNYKCSECGNRALEDNCGCFSILTNYCCECGATMKRKDET